MAHYSCSQVLNISLPFLARAKFFPKTIIIPQSKKQQQHLSTFTTEPFCGNKNLQRYCVALYDDHHFTKNEYKSDRTDANIHQMICITQGVHRQQLAKNSICTNSSPQLKFAAHKIRSLDFVVKLFLISFINMGKVTFKSFPLMPVTSVTCLIYRMSYLNQGTLSMSVNFH